MRGALLEVSRIILFVLFSAYCLAVPGYCGEFVSKQRSLTLDNPSELPTQQSGQLPTKTNSDNKETIYQDFEKKFSTLSPEKRNEVKDAFKQKLAEAQKAGRWEEVSYYSKLLEIMEKAKK